MLFYPCRGGRVNKAVHTFSKCINPKVNILLWVGSSTLVRQLVQEKENSEFKPVKLRLKIDLMSYPARAEGLGKYGNTVSGVRTRLLQGRSSAF